jgi:YfiH family protein
MSLAPLTADLLHGIPHGFFTRKGGVSTGIYASLNCGPGSGDAPDAVAENRARVAAHLGVAAGALRTLHQVHGDRVVIADSTPPAERPQADAMITATPGIAVAALAADCAPVLFADREAGLVAAAHAGWRGALDGVLEAAVARLIDMGAAPERLVAVVGPCISQRAYEVGQDFMERFCDEDPAHARFFAGGPAGRPHFDLPGFCLSRLRAVGVARAEWTGHCTYADEGRFFSFRRATHRGERDYGRLIAAIRMPQSGE